MGFDSIEINLVQKSNTHLFRFFGEKAWKTYEYQNGVYTEEWSEECSRWVYA